MNQDTIAALSTPPGQGGIAVIRISGPDAIKFVNQAWKGADLEKVKSHTLHLGKYFSLEGELLDESVASVFLEPNSFTGENIVELGIHGSTWIQKEILKDLIKRGVRMANPGEFTQRAFMNGRMDLAQAEGVADLISSSSKAAHDLAINQTKGAFSKKFNILRDKLIEFASLLELELDFSEEDVEFADRSKLYELCKHILENVNKLLASYSTGSVLKNGVPVVIAGVPNAGKSSLLNLLLGDDKAIVTEIPGTTRDIIEDTVELDGVLYRFQDTAGIRETDDVVEGIGVEKAKESIEKAYIVIWLLDRTQKIEPQLDLLNGFKATHPDKNIVVLINKADTIYKFDGIDSEKDPLPNEIGLPEAISFSTISIEGHKALFEKLNELVKQGRDLENDIIVTNARHYENLLKASEALSRALASLSPCPGRTETSSLSYATESISNSLPTELLNSPSPKESSATASPTESSTSGYLTESSVYSSHTESSVYSYLTPDLIAQDIREAIHHLSTITGEITTNDLLHSIFSRFCIGK